MNIEAVDIVGARLFHGDQGGAALFGNKSEDRILRVLARIREIDARGKPFEESRSHDAERDVRRLQRVSRSGHASRTDGPEAEPAVFVRRAAAKADEGRIEGDIV